MHAGHVAATHRKKTGGESPRLGGSPRLDGDWGAKKQRKGGRGKGHVTSGWNPLGENSWVLGSGRSEQQDIHNYNTAIVSGSLFARAISSASLEISDHLPSRQDTLFLHPETMKLCGIGIGQLVAVQLIESRLPSLTVCKPWPFRRIELDVVAVSPQIMKSLSRTKEGEEEKELRIELWKVPSSSQLPTASKIHLRPNSTFDSSVLNKSFKNYIRSLYDGMYLCAGNLVSMPFCHQMMEFSVEIITPARGQSAAVNPAHRQNLEISRCNLSALLERSLRSELSQLQLATPSPRQSPSPSVSDKMRGAPPIINVITSTPGGMEVDESRGHYGTESICHHLARTGINDDIRGVSTASLEQQLEGLVLEKGSSELVGEREEEEEEEEEVEVVVCKVTTKTEIKFVKNESVKNKGCLVTMDDVGGLAIQKQLLHELILFPLTNPPIRGVQFPRGILLHGPSGVGKSLLVSALSCSLSVSDSAGVVTLSPLDLQLSDDGVEKMQILFREACRRAPCLIVLEDLHNICCSSNDKKYLSSSLAGCLDNLTSSSHVVVLATTNRIEDIDLFLRQSGRLEREIEVTTPASIERREILKILMRGVAHDITREELVGVADAAHGFTGGDIKSLTTQAQHKALRRYLQRGGGGGGGDGRAINVEGGVVVKVEDIRGALREVRPSAMKEITVEVPKVMWSDIGGQEEVKKRLKEAVKWPLKHPEAFSRLGILPPKGVLLYGPPGCSKTMIARALATETRLNFIAVKGPELFSKWVGDSEKAVRQVFQRARAAAPAIIFFDEIDALAVQRNSSGGSTVADRVLAQLLTEMDGVEQLNEVIVLAATNRPDMIDTALLRPGRIDRLIYVSLPDDNTRREIFEINLKKMSVADDVSIDNLVTQTCGFSGAEVVALCQEAGLCAMHEDISTEEISLRHFQQALKTITPQTKPSTVTSYEQYASNTRKI